MSKRVIFTCTVLLLLGTAGLLDSAAGSARGGWQLNLMALFLPAAVALFLALPGARLGASLVFALHYGLLAMVLAGSTVAGVRLAGAEFFQLPYALMATGVVMFGAVLVLLHWMLYSPPFEEHLGG